MGAGAEDQAAIKVWLPWGLPWGGSCWRGGIISLSLRDEYAAGDDMRSLSNLNYLSRSLTLPHHPLTRTLALFSSRHRIAGEGTLGELHRNRETLMRVQGNTGIVSGTLDEARRILRSALHSAAWGLSPHDATSRLHYRLVYLPQPNTPALMGDTCFRQFTSLRSLSLDRLIALFLPLQLQACLLASSARKSPWASLRASLWGSSSASLSTLSSKEAAAAKKRHGALTWQAAGADLPTSSASEMFEWPACLAVCGGLLNSICWPGALSPRSLHSKSLKSHQQSKERQL